MSSTTVGRGVGALVITVAVGAAPAAWFVHLLVSYLLVPVSCEQGSNVLLHLTTVVTALAAASGGAVAARTWKRTRDEGRAAAFLSVAGLAMSALFLLLILVGGASPLLVRPCAG